MGVLSIYYCMSYLTGEVGFHPNPIGISVYRFSEF